MISQPYTLRSRYALEGTKAFAASAVAAFRRLLCCEAMAPAIYDPCSR